MSDLMIGRNNNANLKKASVNISRFPTTSLTINDTGTGSKEIMEEYVFNNTGDDAAFFDLDKISKDYENVDNYFALNGIDIDKSQVDYENIRTIVDSSNNRTITIIPLKLDDGYGSISFYENVKIASVNYSSCNFHFNDDGTLKTMSTVLDYCYVNNAGNSIMASGNYKSDLAKYMTGEIVGVKINHRGNIVLNFSDGKWIEGENAKHDVNLDEIDSPLEYIANLTADLGKIKTPEDYLESKSANFKRENVREVTKIEEGRFYVHFYPDEGIFAESNSIHRDWFTGEYGQYGANQHVLFEDNEKSLSDPIVLDLIRKSSVGEEITFEEYPEVYNCILSRLCRTCGTIGYVDAIFAFFAGHEKEFYDMFGFPMYNVDESGKKHYNYDYLVLLISLKRANVTEIKTLLEEESISLNDIYAFDDRYLDRYMLGSYKKTLNGEEFVYINDIGIFDCQFNPDSIGSAGQYYSYVKNHLDDPDYDKGNGDHTGVLSDNMKEALFKYYTTINAYNWCYYDRDNTDYPACTAQGGYWCHAMFVTGYTSDGDYIVANAGQEWILKANSMASVNFDVVDFDDSFFDSDWTTDDNEWTSEFLHDDYYWYIMSLK